MVSHPATQILDPCNNRHGTGRNAELKLHIDLTPGSDLPDQICFLWALCRPVLAAGTQRAAVAPRAVQALFGFTRTRPELKGQASRPSI